jgi:hypothetical protein
MILHNRAYSGSYQTAWPPLVVDAAPLPEKDTVVLADFDNATGDAIFDVKLKQALTVNSYNPLTDSEPAPSVEWVKTHVRRFSYPDTAAC